MEPDAFARLMAQQTTEQDRQRLHNLRHDLHLPGDDPVWALVAVLEEFCRSQHHQTTTARNTPRVAASRTWRVALAFSLGAAVTTVLIAVSFYAGVGAASIPAATWCDWPIANGAWVWSVLRLPAGWTLIVQGLPLLVYAGWCGWRTRRLDPVVGWILLALATCIGLLAAVACARMLHH